MVSLAAGVLAAGRRVPPAERRRQRLPPTCGWPYPPLLWRRHAAWRTEWCHHTAFRWMECAAGDTGCSSSLPHLPPIAAAAGSGGHRAPPQAACHKSRHWQARKLIGPARRGQGGRTSKHWTGAADHASAAVLLLPPLPPPAGGPRRQRRPPLPLHQKAFSQPLKAFQEPGGAPGAHRGPADHAARVSPPLRDPPPPEKSFFRAPRWN